MVYITFHHVRILFHNFERKYETRGQCADVPRLSSSVKLRIKSLMLLLHVWLQTFKLKPPSQDSVRAKRKPIQTRADSVSIHLKCNPFHITIDFLIVQTEAERSNCSSTLQMTKGWCWSVCIRDSALNPTSCKCFSHFKGWCDALVHLSPTSLKKKKKSDIKHILKQL